MGKKLNLEILRSEISRHLDEIAEMFVPGIKLTILVRNPAADDGDVLLSDDELEKAIEAMRRLDRKETIVK